MRWSRKLAALALSALSGLTVFPATASADCVERMSRMPMAAQAAPTPRYRAAMLRAGPAPTGVKRPRATKAKATVRKAHVVRKASAHRRPVKVARRAPRPAVVAAARPRPTPMPVAATELATPLSYALISATVCENGPVAAPVEPLRLAMARAPLEPETGVAVPDTGGDTFFPGVTSPDLPSTVSPGPGGTDVVIPPVPPVEPPEVTPPVVTPPEVTPPDKPPLTPEPPITTPPVNPPTGPPVVTPPTGPPIVTPPTEPPVTAVPEPATWALLIAGFGLVGARLRRRRASLLP